jgi:hypothetical protein
MTTWPQNAYVGQRVVCITDDWEQAESYPSWGIIPPTKSTVYTIRSIASHGTRIGLYLKELVNPVIMTSHGMNEVCFIARNFKPVDESKLDQFRKHLIGVPSYDTV